MKIFAGLLTAIIWLPCWWYLLNCYYGSSSDLYMRVHLVNSSGEKVWATLVGTSRHDGARDQALTLYYSSPVPLEVPCPYELTLESSKERVVIYDFDLHQFTGVLVRGKEGPARRLKLPVNGLNGDHYTNEPVIVHVPPLTNLEPLVAAPDIKQPEFFMKVWAIAIVGYLLPVGLVAYISARLRRSRIPGSRASSTTARCGAAAHGQD
jgi:hypothetical protein